MTEFRFHHLKRKTIDQALPPLLEKVVERGMRAVVVAASEERVETVNKMLWIWEPTSFLPHGSARDEPPPDQQPVWLTTQVENPNGAQVLVLTDGVAAESADVNSFSIVFDLFDGNDDRAVMAARARWRARKAAGDTLTYWQQAAQGGWERKA